MKSTCRFDLTCRCAWTSRLKLAKKRACSTRCVRADVLCSQHHGSKQTYVHHAAATHGYVLHTAFCVRSARHSSRSVWCLSTECLNLANMLRSWDLGTCPFAIRSSRRMCCARGSERGGKLTTLKVRVVKRELGSDIACSTLHYFTCTSCLFLQNRLWGCGWQQPPWHLSRLHSAQASAAEVCIA